MKRDETLDEKYRPRVPCWGSGVEAFQPQSVENNPRRDPDVQARRFALHGDAHGGGAVLHHVGGNAGVFVPQDEASRCVSWQFVGLNVTFFR